jgi:hypothetical protein
MKSRFDGVRVKASLMNMESRDTNFWLFIYLQLLGVAETLVNARILVLN